MSNMIIHPTLSLNLNMVELEEKSVDHQESSSGDLQCVDEISGQILQNAVVIFLPGRKW